MGRIPTHRSAPTSNVFNNRSYLSRRQYLNLLSKPNFRYDRHLPQPASPNLAMGQEPIWPISRSAMRAASSARIAQLSTPRQSYTNQHDNRSYHSRRSVSRGALSAQPSTRILEMARPKFTYMVGLTVDKQDRLGKDFREKMRNKIMDTLGSSYADLTLGTRASQMRTFYESQSRQSPFRPFTPLEFSSSRESKTCCLTRSISAVQSIQERKHWDEARSKPKQDFTIYQPVPERKSVPIWKLLPRLEALSQVPEHRKSKDPEKDPYKVSEAAIKAKVTSRLLELAKPKVRKTS